MDAVEYWNARYTLPEGVEHHAKQNETIARDLCAEIKKRPRFHDAFRGKSGIEVGCGTGDLCNALESILYCSCEGTDLSSFAVEVASIRFPDLFFSQHNILKDPPLGTYDIAVASNVIEHFRNPGIVIDRMFEMAPQVVVVSPFNQPISDGYDNEGGAGHVARITLDTFKDYKVEYSFLFRTGGWQHSVDGEVPLQIAVLLGQK